MKQKLFFALLLSSLFSLAHAENEPKQALGFCPLGIPAYNLLAINYEMLFANRHGINLRIDYAPMSADGIDINDKAVIINYRWYYHESFDSIFAGVFSRYRIDQGEGTVAGNSFNYTSKQVTLGVNIGKRWLWNNGFSVVTLMGYGYATHQESISNNNTAINSALDAMKKDYDLFFNNPLFAEFSIGYAF
ncbi:MAG: DUF3575 domain-containing protein [Gammaproteobacteria bacterium]|nr:DUF3575 domain-containing protein [Gammaproteobacteria bacterium]